MSYSVTIYCDTKGCGGRIETTRVTMTSAEAVADRFGWENKNKRDKSRTHYCPRCKAARERSEK